MNTYRFVIINFYSTESTQCLVGELIEGSRKNQREIEVCVYDNSGEYASCYGEEVVKSRGNVGIGPIWYEELSRLPNADYIVFANNDIHVSDDMFDTMDWGLKHSDIITPKIVLPSGKVWSCGGAFSKYLIWKITHFNVLKSDRPYASEHASGCFLVIKVDEHIFSIAKKNLNRYFFRGEEWQINLNLLNHGIGKAVVPEMEIIHEENGSHDRFSAQHIYYAVRAKMLFIVINSGKRSFDMLSYLAYLSLVGVLKYSAQSKLDLFSVYKVVYKAINHGLIKSKIVESDF